MSATGAKRNPRLGDDREDTYPIRRFLYRLCWTLPLHSAIILFMTNATPLPSTCDDPGIAVAGRQLELLTELGEMSMVVCRAYAHAAVAASGAVEAILADDFYQPETGRARALAGAKDAADSFQKVSRSLRLTLALQTTVVDALRDLRAGVYRSKAARDERVASAPRPEAEVSDAAARCERGDSDRERLVEYERLREGEGFRVIVNGIRAEIGHAINWKSRADGRAPVYAPFAPKPPGHECRSGAYSSLADGEDAAAHEEALAP